MRRLYWVRSPCQKHLINDCSQLSDIGFPFFVPKREWIPDRDAKWDSKALIHLPTRDVG